MIWPDPTHQPTQPLTKPHTQPCVGNSSQISNLQTELKYLDKLKCYQILSDSGGPPPWGVADGWMGVGVGMGVWWDVPCMHTCTRMHARTHMHVKHDKYAKHGCLHVGSHLQFLYMYKCACACVHVHVHVCGDTPPYPQMPPHPPAPSPEPQEAQNTKIQ